MMIRMRKRRLLLAATAALLAGCNPLGVCTLIGCENGLFVVLDRTPVGAFRIEATVPGDPTVLAIECVPGGGCHPLFPDLIAEQVTIRVITQQGTVTQQFQPEYQTSYPNGRRCGPECTQATVTVQLPG